MVCHETYQDADGNWLFPEEVQRAGDGSLTDGSGRKVVAGRIEKMSKSRKNVVGLEAVVGEYGADTARLYLLSDSPPERDLEWTDAGIEGVWRHVNRLFTLVNHPGGAQGYRIDDERAEAIDQKLKRSVEGTEK
jgi:leucyl-tRNA synthetase